MVHVSIAVRAPKLRFIYNIICEIGSKLRSRLIFISVGSVRITYFMHISLFGEVCNYKTGLITQTRFSLSTRITHDPPTVQNTTSLPGVGPTGVRAINTEHTYVCSPSISHPLATGGRNHSIEWMS